MGSNIKQAIMDTARLLFNERGYQNTSMRDIAAALRISVGNLTYHYKKKEDLIEAIILEDHQRYQKPTSICTLADFDLLLHKVAAQKKSRPYYYKYYVQLSQICPAIYEMQISVLQDLNDVLMKSFEEFLANGILKREFSQEYGKVADVIMALIVHGLPNFHQARDGENDKAWIECVWSVIIPYLTARGQEEYQSLYTEKGSCEKQL